ncbi:inactive ubiquitin carboxyl-terminal hydrolase 53 [Bombina bombina]|uniref:inactive ubiquitin carboxyl-terminal hydrolase 53 n=1 Tax=Bombina bombina TaxID=8345 RepID=UPI00235AFE4F|nr:inactive ubiquitin carboxyl-terminal hydrolase 53 [Bombina bombina]
MAWVKLFRRQAGGNLGKVYQPGSVLSLAPTKGLFNEPGQNSCFLNSAVQVLWQLDIFRRSLRGLTGHVCLGDACIFCALKSIFAQFQTSREKVLPSDAMRHALAESFKDEHRFQLGLMDDAAECFENILQRIHFHIVPNSEGDMCTSKSCITHQKFAMTLYEQCVCRSCGASSDPLPFTEFVRYISTTALCNEVDRMLERHERLKPEMFAELLQAANTADDFRKCPSNCGQKIKIRRVLMNCPEIVTIGLVWDSDNSDLTEDVVRNLATQLYLPGLFFRVTDEQAKESRLYLVGMICYTSRHYCAFAYHTKSARWILFDDASVKEVGTKWKDVVTKCIRCHYQPLLLFYANPDGTAVSTEDALKQVMQWSHYKTVLPNVEDAGNERLAAAPKKTEYNRDQEFGEHAYHHNNGYKFPVEDSAFNRAVTQSSSGRGPVKIARKDQQEKIKVLSRECAQRAVELKGIPSNQRKNVEKFQKKETTRTKDSSGGMVYQSRSFSGGPLKSGSPPSGGFRPYPDQFVYYSQGKGPYKQERLLHQPRQMPSSMGQAPPGPEAKQMTRMKNTVSTDYDTDSSQEYKMKGTQRNKKAWRPMRETLNVDSIFNEHDLRQPNSRHLENSSGKQLIKDQSSNNCSKESPKRKILMTIYEDEIKQESGSRSSLESLGKCQTDRNKFNPDAKMYHLDSWQMQRTESGYESSDHISSGSSNLDSPIIEATSFTDIKGLQETSMCSDQQQSGSVLLSTSPQTRNNFTGFNKEHNGLEHGRYEDRLSPDQREATHSPSGRRKHIDSKREPRSTNLFAIPTNYLLRDNQMGKLDDKQEYSNCVNSSFPENGNCNCEHSSLGMTQVVSSKILNSNEVIHSQLQQSVASTPGHSQIASQNRHMYMNSQFTMNENLLNPSCSRDVNCHTRLTDLNDIPPPLPPKKYARSAVSRLEQNFAPTINMELSDTLSCIHLNCPERHLPVDLIKHEAEVDYYPNRDTFNGNELYVKANLAGSSVYDSGANMVHAHTLDVVSPGGPDMVSLTTYFSVDNCMTDTYRMKYHQRPKLYMAENAGFHRDHGHLPETVIEPGYHKTLENAHPSLASRSKPTFGSIPCNR